MAVPGIGGIGDIIALVQLASQIVRALKDSRGSERDYYDLDDELKSIASLLTAIRQTIGNSPSSVHGRLVFDACEKFGRAIDESFQLKEGFGVFDTSAGTISLSTRLKKAFKAIEWRFRKHTDAKECRVKLMQARMHLLLTMMMNFSSDVQHCLTEHGADLASAFSSLLSTIQNEAAIARGDLATIREETFAHRADIARVQTDTAAILKNSSETRAIVLTTLPTLHRALAIILAHNRMRLGGAATSGRSTQVAMFLAGASMATSVFESFYPPMHRAFSLSFGALAFAHQAFLYFKPPPVVSQSPDNTVVLVDILGQRMPLWIELCDTPEALHHFLLFIFKDKIGSDYVRRHHYEVAVEDADPRLAIGRGTWSEVVCPGAILEMIVLLPQLGSTSTGAQCPRCKWKIPPMHRSMSSWITCKNCRKPFTISTLGEVEKSARIEEIHDEEQEATHDKARHLASNTELRIASSENDAATPRVDLGPYTNESRRSSTSQESRSTGQAISDLSYCNKIHVLQMADRRTIADLTALGYIPYASYDTYARAGCMEGTCVAILKDLLTWSKDSDSARIFYLEGMAGTGKTSIAFSFSTMLQEDGYLGGSFFCSRAGPIECGDVRRIIPNLAYLLACRSDPFKHALIEQLKKTPDAALGQIRTQIEHLLRQPLSTLSPTSVPCMVFVVDALDECWDRDATTDLLKALIHAAPGLPIKFLVTYRPEIHIIRSLSDENTNRTLKLHECNPKDVDDDIRLYITSRLSTILPVSNADIDTLVRLSNGLFVFASIAVAYIAQGNHLERLRGLTDISPPSLLSIRPLDSMYSFILHEAIIDHLEPNDAILLKQILATIFTNPPLSVATLAAHLNVLPNRVRGVLDRLSAVVHIPDDDGDPGLASMHLSFEDFLTDPRRAPSELLITS